MTILTVSTKWIINHLDLLVLSVCGGVSAFWCWIESIGMQTNPIVCTTGKYLWKELVSSTKINPQMYYSIGLSPINIGFCFFLSRVLLMLHLLFWKRCWLLIGLSPGHQGEIEASWGMPQEITLVSLNAHFFTLPFNMLLLHAVWRG